MSPREQWVRNQRFQLILTGIEFADGRRYHTEVIPGRATIRNLANFLGFAFDFIDLGTCAIENTLGNNDKTSCLAAIPIIGASKNLRNLTRAGKTASGAGTDLARVADFADDAAAFSHYSKHVRAIEFLPNGGYRLKPGGADMPEFGSFAEYRGAARSFMGPDAPSGVLQGYRGTDLLRVDPKTGYFGVRGQSGSVRTFSRPDGDPVPYFWGHL